LIDSNIIICKNKTKQNKTKQNNQVNGMLDVDDYYIQKKNKQTPL
jgi:hypothetical protein